MKKSSFFISVSIMTLALIVAVVGVTAAWFGDVLDYRDPEGPINVSNVMYYDTKAKAPSRIGYKVEDGKKIAGVCGGVAEYLDIDWLGMEGICCCGGGCS